MKIKTLEYALKKGLPNYSSVSAGMTVEVSEGDNLEMVWETMKQEVKKECDDESSWLSNKQPNEPKEV